MLTAAEAIKYAYTDLVRYKYRAHCFQCQM